MNAKLIKSILILFIIIHQIKCIIPLAAFAAGGLAGAELGAVAGGGAIAAEIAALAGGSLFADAVITITGELAMELMTDGITDYMDLQKQTQFIEYTKRINEQIKTEQLYQKHPFMRPNIPHFNVNPQFMVG